MSEPAEGRGQTETVTDPVRLTYTVALSPEQYEQHAYRATSEASCRRKIVQHAANQGLTLLDGAVGRWVQVEQEFDPGDVWTRWEYRLVGYAVPSDSASSQTHDTP